MNISAAQLAEDKLAFEKIINGSFINYRTYVAATKSSGDLTDDIGQKIGEYLKLPMVKDPEDFNSQLHKALDEILNER